MEDVYHGHSLQVVDINHDGNLDIFCAEMNLSDNNPDAKMWAFLGDGHGNFETEVIQSGYGNHESRVGDLDGDGDMDILGKPYNWDTPRLDLWLRQNSLSLDLWQRHVIDSARPWGAVFIDANINVIVSGRDGFVLRAFVGVAVDLVAGVRFALRFRVNVRARVGHRHVHRLAEINVGH